VSTKWRVCAGVAGTVLLLDALTKWWVRSAIVLGDSVPVVGDWYPNAARVRILRGGGPELALGTEFRWRTFGVGIRSTVREFVPGRRIAWDGRSLGIDVYHAWLIEESADGCRVLTEETQHGAIARLGAWLMPKRMSDFHQIWLENLAANAAAGAPPKD
jgi:hypothetical protein